eukprot:6208644-Pleurochrysis_carterae.AAC.1
MPCPALSRIGAVHSVVFGGFSAEVRAPVTKRPCRSLMCNLIAFELTQEEHVEAWSRGFSRRLFRAFLSFSIPKSPRACDCRAHDSLQALAGRLIDSQSS